MTYLRDGGRPTGVLGGWWYWEWHRGTGIIHGAPDGVVASRRGRRRGVFIIKRVLIDGVPKDL